MVTRLRCHFQNLFLRHSAFDASRDCIFLQGIWYRNVDQIEASAKNTYILAVRRASQISLTTLNIAVLSRISRDRLIFFANLQVFCWTIIGRHRFAIRSILIPGHEDSLRFYYTLGGNRLRKGIYKTNVVNLFPKSDTLKVLLGFRI